MFRNTMLRVVDSRCSIVHLFFYNVMYIISAAKPDEINIGEDKVLLPARAFFFYSDSVAKAIFLWTFPLNLSYTK